MGPGENPDGLAAGGNTRAARRRTRWRRHSCPGGHGAEIAPRVNALVAPAIPYGFTGIMDAYPGSFTVPEAAFRGYVSAVLAGLAKNKFKNIIVLNGHGGGQTAVLSALAQEVGRETGTRILVVNWWSYCSDVTLEVFGEDGGHGAENETAYIMAIDPALFRKGIINLEMATALPPPNTWSASPFPSPSCSTRKARVIRNSIR